jgi:hypothetical protein
MAASALDAPTVTRQWHAVADRVASQKREGNRGGCLAATRRGAAFVAEARIAVDARLMLREGALRVSSASGCVSHQQGGRASQGRPPRRSTRFLRPVIESDGAKNDRKPQQLFVSCMARCYIYNGILGNDTARSAHRNIVDFRYHR